MAIGACEASAEGCSEQFAASALNARRYEFIREKFRRHGTFLPIKGIDWDYSTAESMDSAIDAAMAKELP